MRRLSRCVVGRWMVVVMGQRGVLGNDLRALPVATRPAKQFKRRARASFSIVSTFYTSVPSHTIVTQTSLTRRLSGVLVDLAISSLLL
jgi:hypothetical protein